MAFEPKNPEDEALFMLDRSSVPLAASDLYERSVMVDEYAAMCRLVHALRSAGKIVPADVVNGKPRYIVAPKGAPAAADAETTQEGVEPA